MANLRHASKQTYVKHLYTYFYLKAPTLSIHNFSASEKKKQVKNQ